MRRRMAGLMLVAMAVSAVVSRPVSADQGQGSGVQGVVSTRAKTPRPLRNTEEDEAVEVVDIRSGDRIAQLVIAPVAQAELELVDELPESRRGAGGFGSTGT